MNNYEYVLGVKTRDENLVNKVILPTRVSPVLLSLIDKYLADKKVNKSRLFRSRGAMTRTALMYLLARMSRYEEEGFLEPFVDDIETEFMSRADGRRILQE